MVATIHKLSIVQSDEGAPPHVLRLRTPVELQVRLVPPEANRIVDVVPLVRRNDTWERVAHAPPLVAKTGSDGQATLALDLRSLPSVETVSADTRQYVIFATSCWHNDGQLRHFAHPVQYLVLDDIEALRDVETAHACTEQGADPAKLLR